MSNSSKYLFVVYALSYEEGHAILKPVYIFLSEREAREFVLKDECSVPIFCYEIWVYNESRGHYALRNIWKASEKKDGGEYHSLLSIENDVEFRYEK